MVVIENGKIKQEVLRVDKEIARGAEAYIYKGSFLGIPCIIKLRTQKSYRHPVLDSKIIRDRTIREAKIIISARRIGIKAPAVLFVDPDLGVLVLEYIKGRLLKDLLKNLDDEEACKIASTAGSYAALLHTNGIVHGDLTTSNMIYTDHGLFLVDFGLSDYSNDLEDLGVDVHLFLRSLESTLWRRASMLYECFLKGYQEIVGKDQAFKVKEKVREIRLRGRYIAERRMRS